MSIANFDVFPAELLNNAFFNFSRKDKVKEIRFLSLEMDSYNFIRNAQSTFWIIVLTTIFSIVVKIGLRAFKKGKPR